MQQIQADVTVALLVGLYASAMAGLFEEGFRYFLLRRRAALRATGRTVLAFGLGWGLGEAVILFVPAVALLPLVPGAAPAAGDVLLGSLERNLAILAHVALTYIVLHAAVRARGLLVLAIFLHFALNAAAVAALLYTGNPFLAELVLASVAVVMLVISTWASRGWSVPPMASPEGSTEELGPPPPT